MNLRTLPFIGALYGLFGRKESREDHERASNAAQVAERRRALGARKGNPFPIGPHAHQRGIPFPAYCKRRPGQRKRRIIARRTGRV